jgi:hypothetical protein
MAEVTVHWRGDEVLADIEAAVAEGMELAGKVLATSTQRKVSTPYPPASRPGQPPHRRSGGLAGAVGHRVTRSGRNVTLDVGVPDSSSVGRQARALQKGTGRMAARPFLPEEDQATTTVVGYVEGAVRASIGRS